jgi:hypothetical protein
MFRLRGRERTRLITYLAASGRRPVLPIGSPARFGGPLRLLVEALLFQALGGCRFVTSAAGVLRSHQCLPAGRQDGDHPYCPTGHSLRPAAIVIIDVAGFRELWQLSRAEFALAGATALGVMVFDVLTGVLIAVALSAGVALWRIARPSDAVLGGASELDGWVAIDDFPTAHPLPGLLVYRFDAPLFFANAEWFRQRVRLALEINPGVEEWIIFDFDGVGSIDTTAVEMLQELLGELPGLGIDVIGIARANNATIDRLNRAGLLEPDGSIRSFPTINFAVREFQGS